MQHFAARVITESHELYPDFMRQRSHCIFEVDPKGACRLIEAECSQLEGEYGMLDKEHVTLMHSYSGHLRHVLNQKSQVVLGLQMVKDFTKPAAYTG